MIPISTVRLGDDVAERVLEVIRSGIIAQGPVVAEFEREFATLQQVEHAVAVNNGTTALVASLEVLDLEEGDEVVTTPFTFAATLNAILEAGATVRFADIRLDDYCIDPESISARLTDRTRVVMPVHLYGQAADMAPIAQIAASRGLSIVEDAAQAHGATYGGAPVGGFGLAGFSFYATKNLTTGEGGMITTNDGELADKLRILRNQGMRARYEYVMAGHNYRLTDLAAAVVLPQLATYADQLAARRRNAAGLIERLGEVDGLVLPQELPGREHVWHQFTVLLPDGTDRAAFVDRLTAAGVGSGIYYPRLVHDYGVYRKDPRVVIEETPNAALVASRCLSLPVHAGVTEADLDVIASAVREAVEAR
ncbi:DegT/DnrJ/EryC1/StrS family aminotransferase [Microbacterium sp. B2969]|uniref:DegT/DnrJ/EryC1/StrS family aminotransferase n=1 Tax=Microbacterium alkaliflavum TaxID=3248839 RepID=A0ABW7Q7A3_9MICO